MDQIDQLKESTIRFSASEVYPVITFGPFPSSTAILISLSHAIGIWYHYLYLDLLHTNEHILQDILYTNAQLSWSSIKFACLYIELQKTCISVILLFILSYLNRILCRFEYTFLFTITQHTLLNPPKFFRKLYVPLFGKYIWHLITKQ